MILSNRLVQVSQQPNNCFFDVKIKTGGKKKKNGLPEEGGWGQPSQAIEVEGSENFLDKA